MSPVIRNKLSTTFTGGPRQFSERRDRFIISASDFDAVDDAVSELDRFDLEADKLNNEPILIAQPRNKIEDVFDRVIQLSDIDANITKIRQAISEVERARRTGNPVLEASISTVNATRELINIIRKLSIINTAQFVRTQADYGPANLRLNPKTKSNLDVSTAESAKGNLRRLYNEMGLPEAWETTRGENAICAIFDTGYSKDLFSNNRIVNTFHGGSVDSVYASSEGHGTMCAGAALANNDRSGVPFNGTAPEAGIVLVRITDDKGQIRTDIISEAWDWLIDLDVEKPIISNHSYGTPLCSGRPKQKFCNSPQNDLIKRAVSTSDISAFYASGNESGYCGRRPSGITNAITGTNSLAEVITVGALLTNGREIQRYSSHGRGDCSPISDPKPNVTTPIPMVTYYGGEDGWELKDMSTGPFGSGGGTSHASPTTAGIATLMQSKAVADAENGKDSGIRGENGAMQTEEIKQILENTAKIPHANQINKFGILFSESGYDARFGNGAIQVNQALMEV